MGNGAECGTQYSFWIRQHGTYNRMSNYVLGAFSSLSRKKICGKLCTYVCLQREGRPRPKSMARRGRYAQPIPTATVRARPARSHIPPIVEWLPGIYITSRLRSAGRERDRGCSSSSSSSSSAESRLTLRHRSLPDGNDLHTNQRDRLKAGKVSNEIWMYKYRTKPMDSDNDLPINCVLTRLGPNRTCGVGIVFLD